MEIAAIFRIASGWRVRSSGGTLVKPFCKPSELPYCWRASCGVARPYPICGIFSNWHDSGKGCYVQIPHASYNPQEFDDKINMNLFKDVPLLCCYKRIKKGNEK